MSLSERISHVFNWPSKYQIRVLFPVMLAGSLLIHLAGLYLIRTTTSIKPVALPPLPEKVSILSMEEGALLLAAKDPSWRMPGRYRDRLLRSPRAVRSMSALSPELPALLENPETIETTVWVPALPPLQKVSLLGKLQPTAISELAPLSARFDVGGPAITEDVLSRLRAVAPADPVSAATELIVVLNAGGEARHVWIIRSSGNQALDFAARRAVQLAHFAPSENGYRGVLRIHWGSGRKNEEEKP